LETILAFVKEEVIIPKAFGDINLDGKKWGSLDIESRQRFWNYVIPVEFINVNERQDINEAFGRLNRNSRKLTEQEFRHSQFNGWFIAFAEKESEEKFWKDIGVVTAARAKRMQDVQFISELLLVSIEQKIHGFDQDVLSEKYAKYDDNLEDASIKDAEDEIKERFARTKECVQEMEKTNNCVSYHTTALQNFYTLWAFMPRIGKEILGFHGSCRQTSQDRRYKIFR